jgi:hypothetical protein
MNPLGRRTEALLTRSRACRAVLVAAALMVAASSAFAADRYALVVSGASGGEPYASKYNGWRNTFVGILHERLGYPDDHVFVLAEHETQGAATATREGVQRAFGELRRRLTKDDLLLVFLVGHGTVSDGDEAKFNLVGPDLSATEWADLVRTVPARLVFIDGTSASFPFMRRLAGRGRVVVTATDSDAESFETVFPQFFIDAFTDPAADQDKNGRISLWEAFAYASAHVRASFEQRGELPTERPVLDDNGDAVGQEAQNPGPDGVIARQLFFEREESVTVGSGAMGELLKKKAELEAEIEALKARKSTMQPDEYQAELERLLVELARVARQIQPKT